MSDMHDIFEHMRPIGDMPDGPIEDWLVTPMGLPTGITKLDDNIRGLQPQDYVVIAGSTSIGKSAFTTGMCLHFPPECPVLLCSLEMRRKEVQHRMLANLTQLDWHRIMTKDIRPDDRRKIADARRNLEGRKIIVDDASFLTPSMLRAKIEHMADLVGAIPRVVIVDYVQLMAGDTRENRQQEVTGISHSLRAISRDYNMSLVAVAQLNRSPGSRPEEGFRPRISDLRESGSLEQDATKVILLHRPGYWARECASAGVFELEGVGEDEVEIDVGKNRHGPTGIVHASWRPECMMFHDKPDEF